MPDGTLLPHDVDDWIDYAVHVSCECFCDLERVTTALAEIADLASGVTWHLPRVPGPMLTTDEFDLVLIFTNKARLGAAQNRMLAYQAQGKGALLLCLTDHPLQQHFDVPGVVVQRQNLCDTLIDVVETLLVPAFSQGLVCIDWHDIRWVINLPGHADFVEVSGDGDLDRLAALALQDLLDKADTRPINGVLAVLTCPPEKMKLNHMQTLLSACNAVISEEALSFGAMPFTGLPADASYNIRLFAKIGMV